MDPDTLPCLPGTTPMACACCSIGLRPRARISTWGVVWSGGGYKAVPFCRSCYQAGLAVKFICRVMKKETVDV